MIGWLFYAYLSVLYLFNIPARCKMSYANNREVGNDSCALKLWDEQLQTNFHLFSCRPLFHIICFVVNTPHYIPFMARRTIRSIYIRNVASFAKRKVLFRTNFATFANLFVNTKGIRLQRKKNNEILKMKGGIILAGTLLLLFSIILQGIAN